MLIGLLGYARSGKDEACRQLGFARCAFADALKASVDPLFPADTPKEIKRETYVAYGRAMRRIDPDYWLKQLVIPDAPNVCCTDVRYVNECRHLLDRGARLLWVRKSNVTLDTLSKIAAALKVDARDLITPKARRVMLKR